MKRKVIIDCDPGIDDGLALMLAVSSGELDIRGITIVCGNSPTKLGFENAKRVLKQMVRLNRRVLEQVDGRFRALEVINSGSCFELPKETLSDIASVVRDKQIGKLFFEAHWIYRYRLQEMRERMPAPVIYKIGVETFDNEFRQKVLNKNAGFQDPEEVAAWFDSPCLMVGIRGQTKEMIDHDIRCLKKYFKLGTVNVYNNNTTPIRRDEELVRWFMKEYEWLFSDPSVEVLYEITDFGVG